jgi:hypothetical protein
VQFMERETGVEPATSTLARSRSTTELLPLDEGDYKLLVPMQQRTGWLTDSQSTSLIRQQYFSAAPIAGLPVRERYDRPAYE